MKLTAAKIRSLIVLLTLVVVFPSSLSVADTVYLNGGRKVIGIIDRASSDDRQVTIKTSFGTQKIPRIKIKAINVEENTSYTEANGDIAVVEGQLDRGLKLYRKALNNDPGNIRLQRKIKQMVSDIENRNLAEYEENIQLIRDKIATGVYQEAIKDVEMWFIRAINAVPKNPNYYLSLAINLHQHRKQEDKALNYYMEYIRLGGRESKVREWIRECGGTPPEF